MSSSASSTSARSSQRDSTSPEGPRYKWRTSISISGPSTPSKEGPRPRFDDLRLKESFDASTSYAYGMRRASGQATTHEDMVNAFVKFERERHGCRAGCYECSSCLSRSVGVLKLAYMSANAVLEDHDNIRGRSCGRDHAPQVRCCHAKQEHLTFRNYKWSDAGAFDNFAVPSKLDCISWPATIVPNLDTQYHDNARSTTFPAIHTIPHIHQRSHVDTARPSTSGQRKSFMAVASHFSL